MVVVSEHISEWIDKGEVIDRYYNPGRVFDEVDLVALMLTYTPPWANGGASQLTTPTNTQDFADFATAAARRYPGVRLWMVWGEPDFGNKYQPLVAQTRFDGHGLNAAQAKAPRNYARILDASYGALKAVSKRPITVEQGTNTLLGLAPERIREIPSLLHQPSPYTPAALEGWDGRAAERIVDVLERRFDR
jgi:hypothetical protein